MTTIPAEKLESLAESFEEVIFVTHGTDGSFHGRPMQVAGREGAAVLWLVTSHSSEKVAEIVQDQRTLITMQGRGRFVTLSGTVRLVRDPDKAAQLWSPVWRAWFLGPRDPDLVLLRVQIEEGAYWDRKGTMMAKAALQMARRMVTAEGRRPEVDPQEHAYVSFSG